MLRRDFREMLGSELISVTGGTVAGLLLTFAVDKLYLIPSLLILLPGFLEMRGNISGSLSARITSGLFVGAFKSRYNEKSIIKGNVIASVLLVIILSFILGVIVYFAGMIFFGVANPNIIFIALLAGILSNLIEVPLAIITTLWLFRHGHDPNNIMGPYVTTTGDITSIISLMIAILVI